MASTTSLAITLAEHSVASQKPLVKTRDALVQHCRQKEPTKQDNNVDDEDLFYAATSDCATHNWREAYATWKEKTYNADVNNGFVPNAKQTEVLELVHLRCVTEQCEADMFPDVPPDPF